MIALLQTLLLVFGLVVTPEEYNQMSAEDQQALHHIIIQDENL